MSIKFTDQSSFCSNIFTHGMFDLYLCLQISINTLNTQLLLFNYSLNKTPPPQLSHSYYSSNKQIMVYMTKRDTVDRKLYRWLIEVEDHKYRSTSGESGTYPDCRYWLCQYTPFPHTKGSDGTKMEENLTKSFSVCGIKFLYVRWDTPVGRPSSIPEDGGWLQQLIS